MKAIWIHDCDQCKYAGSMFHENKTFDWYVCNDSVVARFGDDGPEYWSMPKDMVEDDRYLIARRSDNVEAINDMQLLAQSMLRRIEP